MKKIKILLIIVFIILLSGCSGTYNLKINEDLSIDENLDIVVDKGDDTYEKTLNLFERNKIDKKKYKVIATDKVVKITYDNTYTSIEDYIINSNLYKQMFNDISYSKDNKRLLISTNSKMYLNKTNSNYIYNNLDISSFKINIETPFRIIDNDADESTDNVLSWKIDNNTTNKDINFELNLDSAKSKYVQIIVLSMIGAIVLISLFIVITRFIKSRKI